MLSQIGKQILAVARALNLGQTNHFGRQSYPYNLVALHSAPPILEGMIDHNCSGTLRRLFMPPTSEDVNGVVGCLPKGKQKTSRSREHFSAQLS